jgi:hypothetical protein
VSGSEQLPGLIMRIADPVSGESALVSVPMPVAIDIQRVISTVGIEAAQNIAWLGAMVFQHELSEQEFYGLRAIIEQTKAVVEQWKDDEDMLLNHSYVMLRNKLWTREEAAQFAASIQGRTISTGAWRQRVNRWATAHGYPAIRQPKRKSRKLSVQTAHEAAIQL